MKLVLHWDLYNSLYWDLIIDNIYIDFNYIESVSTESQGLSQVWEVDQKQR